MPPSPRTLRVALAQMNPTVGDIPGNTRRIREQMEEAYKAGASLAVFPELAVTGYPPRDLLEIPRFVEENIQALDTLAGAAKGIMAIVGFVDREKQANGKPARYNAAALLREGRIHAVRHKSCLPTYDVFDEDRYFQPSPEALPVEAAGLRLGVTICEDLWADPGPAPQLRKKGVDLLVNLSASPFHAGKRQVREQLLARRAREAGVPLLYVNQVGGQDDLVFDGGSYAVGRDGTILAMAPRFEEHLLLYDLPLGRGPGAAPGPRPMEPVEEEVYRALVLGTRDYLRKNGFQKALVGLSGGIDSSLVATIASDALGPQNVVGVTMPGPYSSPGSIEDSRQLAKNLSIEFRVQPITPLYDSYMRDLASHFEGTPPGVAEENLQARIRGTLLMALSNKFGWLVLSTGNKSEMATGYCTLYGDLAGGLAVISDVPKTLVYRLARWRNSQGKTIPDACLTKPPTAELRANQTDQDTLPPYDVLDGILQAYIEEFRSRDEIVARGHDRAIVERVLRMVDGAEYKRKQAPPGLKVTTKAFGSGRVMPITNRWGK
ncbi:MAG: NAD+ synthase [Euryarchaeota archaeon]|nr:NAD+ synthase [Euryarchaeota archaeon]